MAHKRIGQLSVSGEWARHLRPLLRRAFWKKERGAAKAFLRSESVRDARDASRLVARGADRRIEDE
jgi:hypothetical protein